MSTRARSEGGFPPTKELICKLIVLEERQSAAPTDKRLAQSITEIYARLIEYHNEHAIRLYFIDKMQSIALRYCAFSVERSAKCDEFRDLGLSAEREYERRNRVRIGKWALTAEATPSEPSFATAASELSALFTRRTALNDALVSRQLAAQQSAMEERVAARRTVSFQPSADWNLSSRGSPIAASKQRSFSCARELYRNLALSLNVS